LNLRITPYRSDIQIQPFIPDNRIYEELGEEGIRDMISRLYDALVQSDIQEMFPKEAEELQLAKERAADFIIQRFGGPKWYAQRRGKPLLSQRHAPFRITPKSRTTWLRCYREVLETTPLSEKTRQEYWRFIDEFSTWMVNTPEEPVPSNGFRPVIHPK